MNCVDFHCDTLFRMHREGHSFASSSLHLNRRVCISERRRIQVFALWADCKKNGEDAWRECILLLHRYGTFWFLPKNTTGIFAIEDAKILCGKLDRLLALRHLGVRIITFFWKDENELGGGWNTNQGLTSFGRTVLTECFRLGIVPDISHASLPAAEEILYAAKRSGNTVIASHGGAYSVCNHRRNLPDLFLKAVAQCGGRIGMTMVPAHLTNEREATVEHFAAHLAHLYRLNLERYAVLGCDFDGCDRLPRPIRSAKDLSLLRKHLLSTEFTEEQCNLLFWENGYAFSKKYLV